MNDLELENYARLIVECGVNIQQGQTLVVSSPIECASFARRIAAAAYTAGARDVVMNWNDELSNKVRFDKAPQEVFDEFPEWLKALYIENVERKAAFVSIAASDPELLKDVEPAKVARAQKARKIALERFFDSIMSNGNAWTVVSVPTLSWAKKIFPLLNDEAAMAELWRIILMTVRADLPDPVAAWVEHTGNLRRRAHFLNEQCFKSLHYTNSIGTDVVVELPKGHLWMCGGERTAGGVEFIANMPTEEVFTLPAKNGVNGTIVSALPLHYNGNLINGFSLKLEAGKIVDFSAKQGQNILAELLATDEGSRFLGEVALVPYDSPIRNTGVLFFNTLFDENAACHFAFGKAYPTCLEKGEHMSREELDTAGANDSLTHEDFMVGTKDLRIVGTRYSGEKVPVFENGNFAF